MKKIIAILALVITINANAFALTYKANISYCKHEKIGFCENDSVKLNKTIEARISLYPNIPNIILSIIKDLESGQFFGCIQNTFHEIIPIYTKINTEKDWAFAHKVPTTLVKKAIELIQKYENQLINNTKKVIDRTIKVNPL